MDRYKLPERLPFSKKRLPVRVMISYILDYVIIVVLIIGFTALGAVEPFHQHFSVGLSPMIAMGNGLMMFQLRNYTLQYPYAVKERVPIVLLAFVAVACPAMIIIVYTMMIDGFFSHHKPDGSAGGNRRLLNGRYRLKDRLWELNCGILGLGLSVATAYTITGALKNATGKPRPDLIDRCQPKAGSQDPLPFGLSNSTICTQTDHAILQDGFRSFPSGHSSSEFFWNPYDPKHH
jgi:diacylglycerol diphosphate phosphatase/phosphatidate phosphatase